MELSGAAMGSRGKNVVTFDLSIFSLPIWGQGASLFVGPSTEEVPIVTPYGRTLGLCCCTARAPEWWLHLCHPYSALATDTSLRKGKISKYWRFCTLMRVKTLRAYEPQIWKKLCNWHLSHAGVMPCCTAFQPGWPSVSIVACKMLRSQRFRCGFPRFFPLLSKKCSPFWLASNVLFGSWLIILRFFWCVTSVVSNIWYFNISDYDHADNAYLNSLIHSISGWWFGTFFIFTYIGNNNPNWLIFFTGVETTNRI